MILTCPKCGKEFDWEPPHDIVVIKHLTSADLEDLSYKERYAVRCPHCKTLFSAWV